MVPRSVSRPASIPQVSRRRRRVRSTLRRRLGSLSLCLCLLHAVPAVPGGVRAVDAAPPKNTMQLDTHTADPLQNKINEMLNTCMRTAGIVHPKQTVTEKQWFTFMGCVEVRYSALTEAYGRGR